MFGPDLNRRNLLESLAGACMGLMLPSVESVAHGADLKAKVPPPATPNAVGFGAQTSGGIPLLKDIGPKTEITVVQITSLKDSGPGTLREAIEFKRTSNQPLVITFKISGVIKLESPLKIEYGNISILGETAPKPGIALLAPGGVIISRCENVWLSNLDICGESRALKGVAGDDRDVVTIYGTKDRPVKNIYLERCNLRGGVDECLGMAGHVSDVTISRCAIGDPLFKAVDPISKESLHPKGERGMGILIGEDCRRITVVHSLIYNSRDRTFRVKEGAQEIELIENVFCNWGDDPSNLPNFGDPKGKNAITASVVGCVFVPGRKSVFSRGLVQFINDDVIPGSQIYVEGNLYSAPNAPKDKTLPKWCVAEPVFTGSGATRYAPKAKVLDTVLAEVGPIYRSPYLIAVAKSIPLGGSEYKNEIVVVKEGTKLKADQMPLPTLTSGGGGKVFSAELARQKGDGEFSKLATTIRDLTPKGNK